MRKSWFRFPGLLGAFVIVLALVAPVRADVDWSAYIDHSARKAPAAAPAKTSRAKVTKRTTKKIAKAKVKARAKKKARRK